MMKYASYGNIAERVFLTVIGVGALLMGGKTLIIGVITGLSTLLNFFISRWFLKRITDSIPKPNFAHFKAIARQSTPYFLWSLFGVIYYRIDAIMLSFMSPESVVGWYGAAYRFWDILMFLPAIFNSAVFPILSRLWANDRSVFSSTTQKSLDFIFLMGIPISIGGIFYSSHIIGLFYGLEGYGPSVPLFEIFAVGLLLVYIDMVLGPAIFACDRQRHWAVVAFLAIFVNVGLNLLLIPYAQQHYGNGGVGASISTLVTEVFVMWGALFILPREVLANAKITAQVKGLVAGAIMAGALLGLRFAGIYWIVEGMIGYAIYIAAVFLMKTFEPVELEFIVERLKLQRIVSLLARNRKSGGDSGTPPSSGHHEIGGPTS